MNVNDEDNVICGELGGCTKLQVYTIGRHHLKVCKFWSQEKDNTDHIFNDSVVNAANNQPISLNYQAIKLDSKSVTISYEI